MIVEVPQFFNICYYPICFYPIKVYDNMNDVIKENPTFKGQPIRGVCNGSKKTAYGFIWRYVNSDGTIKE